ALIGARLTDCWVGRKDMVREGITSRSWYTGAVVQQVQRHGKSVAIRFVKGQAVRYVVAELGMTGLLLFPSVQIRHPQHVHVRMTFSGGREPEVRYWNPRRFGRLSLLDQEGLDRYVARRFGCDPLTVVGRFLSAHQESAGPVETTAHAPAGCCRDWEHLCE
ncbi:MAG: hypothetical protein HP498_01255, partial [Nitrospira sp.]|nr:hypothetical protein [Nitrospira sp.]